MVPRLFYLLSILLTANMVSAQDIRLEWVGQYSSPKAAATGEIVTDADEQIYMVGIFEDSLQIQTLSGPVLLVGETKRAGYGFNVFVLKANSEGSVIWAKMLTGKGQMDGTGIAVDAGGNVYVSGHYKDSTDFDPGTAQVIRATDYFEEGTPGSDGHIKDYRQNSFVVKLDKDGVFKWVRDFHGKQNVANDVAVFDKDGKTDVYVVGAFQDTIDVNGRTRTNLHTTTPAHPDVYIVKLSGEGDYIWSRQMGRPEWPDIALAVHVDAKGFVYTTGSFADSADFDPGSGVQILRSASAPASNVFISKLDSAGRHIRAVGVGGTTPQRGSIGDDITTDRFGNIVITGYYQVSADFDPLRAGPASQIVGNGNVACYVAVYDSSFRFKWVKALTSNAFGLQQGRGVAVDDAGSVYTTGHFTNDINLNPNNNPPHIVNTPKTNVPNTFISKFDSAGVYAWAKTYPGDFNMGYSIAVTDRRHVYVGGHFFDTVNFNAEGTAVTKISTNKNADPYLMKLACVEGFQDTIEVAECAASFEFNGVNYTASGIYEQFFFAENWCDSLVYLKLTLKEIPSPTITVQDNILSTTQAYDSYQWYLNNDSIPGAVSRTYEATENGVYTVKVTNTDGCEAVSPAYEVNNLRIDRWDDYRSMVEVYPNPANNVINISVKADAEVLSLDGRIMLAQKAVTSLNISQLPDGVYILRIKQEGSGTMRGVVRFVKNSN